MSIIPAVNRSLGKAVRATHDAETGSPDLADAVLAHHLRPLQYRLVQIEQSRPGLLAELADHLGTAAALPAVMRPPASATNEPPDDLLGNRVLRHSQTATRAVPGTV